ncbi:hypothetical protein AZ78_4209 [Lysobacter capsici AZ78]|uniref:Uncharacterized protein n=1 Tax=Lysobacter capsici AZ78 TaxID=1444315 RepID=A0A120AHT0_9GAMM|nr:hypothetical protein AZ78_4209 [Lysobacter capsici AZ78]
MPFPPLQRGAGGIRFLPAANSPNTAITRRRPRSRTLCASLTNAQMPEHQHPSALHAAVPPPARGPAAVAPPTARVMHAPAP